MKALWIVVALVALAGCTSTNIRKVAVVAPVDKGARILLVQPDVQLSVQTMAGAEEPRADWSASAKTSIAEALNSWVVQRGHNGQGFDPGAAMDGRIGQVIRLNEAVAQSILLVEYAGFSLPTKSDGFDWTLGPGAQTIQSATGARYALFLVARGSYADAARVAAAVGMALLGVATPVGGQYLMASLVDLESGRVVWFNVASVSAGGADMRTPEGARDLMTQVMQDAPL